MSVLLTSSDMFLQLTAQFLYVWVVYEMHGCVTRVALLLICSVVSST